MHALDFLHQVADGLEHAVDLTVAAFDEGDFVPRVGGVFEEANFARRKFDAAMIFKGDRHAVAEPGNGFGRGATGDFHVVGFWDVGGRFGQLLGEGPVVGEKEEAFARVVEAADGIESLFLRAKKLHDGGPTFGIAGGGDVAFGLVQQKIDEALGPLKRFAVEENGVSVCIGFAAEFRDRAAVHLDAAGENDLFRFAARGHARSGEDFLETIGHSGFQL